MIVKGYHPAHFFFFWMDKDRQKSNREKVIVTETADARKVNIRCRQMALEMRAEHQQP